MSLSNHWRPCSPRARRRISISALSIPSIAVPVLAAALVALAASACVSADVAIDESHDDATVSATRGNFVSIALPSDPGAGLGWVVTSVDAYYLRQEEEPMFVARSDAGDAPGVDLFRFRAMADGETGVELEYRQTVDGTVETLRTFAVTIVIAGSPAR